MKAARKWGLGVFSIFCLVLFAACGNQQASPSGQSSAAPASTASAQPQSNSGDTANLKMPKEIRIGYQVIPNAELLAKAMKFYEQKFAGVTVNWRQFQSARDVNTAITAGSIDVGLIGSSSVATGIAQDLPYQVIWIHDIIGDNEALVVKKNSGVSSIKDTVGKKIAVPFGSTTHYSFLSALKLNNIDPAKVTILDMQPQEMLAAWKAGQIDGGYVWYPILGEMEKDGNVIITSRNLSEKGIITADVCVASKDFIKNYPAAVTRYIEALDQSVKFYRSSKDQAVAAMAKELNVSEADAKLFMDQLVWLDASEQAGDKYLGTPDNKGQFAKALMDTAEFLKGQKVIASVPDLDTYKAALQSQFVTAVSKEK
ncbi:taurine ABC transporter substrate-binding protein [Ferviditalea candida]|uniref:ABC transporter substrate-binding protein n=1 Tax=Ferviditalea candida TaxID=3108399 RepID=A0ABU5ZER2_9BACL|nr:ABC transporter substrate-binding protein [Paenibacillaceae bacterium T2]